MNFDQIEEMKGFIRKDNLIGKHKVGSSIKAVILDVDYKRNIIDLPE